ncbi:FMN-binding negative transcriptional regulator [Oleiagrimonas sp. C23AA]|uniref:FMN-binding negative transcriptional regulator n=1 Tax=Oleiagrimonas sp. C23AA TaxID=2719047 RepID=UPI001420DA7B|nr:FMN-binding negative transcriptional regulator [Oleiagrimonas sp. C23AA]NII10225.1 FMN-binding negative transcriptional regulator [Oleiagrimonas sp. C23AA]
MYLPAAFEETRVEAIDALIRAHPFATLIVGGKEAPCVEHVPLLRDAEGRLRGHVAAGNALAAADGAEVVAIFHGPQAYVSPNWYPSKHENGRAVPTWNYAVVHLQGRLRVRREHAWLRALLSELTDTFEAGQAQPWHVDDAPADYVERLLGAIAGLEIEVDHVSAKFKLSQNHPAANRQGVIDGLRQRGQGDDVALAGLMQAAMQGTQA